MLDTSQHEVYAIPALPAEFLREKEKQTYQPQFGYRRVETERPAPVLCETRKMRVIRDEEAARETQRLIDAGAVPVGVTAKPVDTNIQKITDLFALIEKPNKDFKDVVSNARAIYEVIQKRSDKGGASAGEVARQLKMKVQVVGALLRRLDGWGFIRRVRPDGPWVVALPGERTRSRIRLRQGPTGE